MKIAVKDNKIITLEELFDAKKASRIELSKLPFKDKIKMLIDLQKLASTWGNRKDVLVWQG